MNHAEVNPKNKTVFVQRHFNATCQKIYRAWTDPMELQKWFGPEGVVTSVAIVDLRVGGQYRISMKSPNGETVDHYGEYREIIPNEKLIFTWLLDGQLCEGTKGEYAETLVTVEFKSVGAGTEVSLTHQYIPSETFRECYEDGWNGSFKCLERVLQG